MISNAIFNNYFNSLLSGDRDKCQQIVLQLLKQETHFRDCYIKLFHNSLYRIGRLWEENKISIATEHLVTNITENIIANLNPSMHARSATGQKIVITCCENEFHSVGARIVSDYFELNGWQVYLLGANTPLRDLLLFLQEYKPDVCGISATMPQNLQNLASTISAIRNLFPKMKMIVGGQAFEDAPFVPDNLMQNVIYLRNLEEVEMFIIQSSV